MFSRATITLGIGSHSSSLCVIALWCIFFFSTKTNSYDEDANDWPRCVGAGKVSTAAAICCTSTFLTFRWSDQSDGRLLHVLSEAARNVRYSDKNAI